MKKLNANVKKIYLIQQEQVDTIYFELDAPTSVPSNPEFVPFFLAVAEPGYGGIWLKEAFGLQPDEVIDEGTDLSRFVGSLAAIFQDCLNLAKHTTKK